MDLSTLGLAARKLRGARRVRVLAAITGVGGIAAVDLFAASRALRSRDAAGGRRTSVELQRSITINRPPSDVFSFWRNVGNLPQVMPYLERVEVRDDTHSHWVAKAPVGHWEWDAEITHEERDRVIGWRATEPTRLPNSGEVRFATAPGGRGTEVRVSMTYHLPGGAAGVTLARVAGEDPDQQLREGLRRLKQVLECGEVIAVDELVSARGPVQRRVTQLVRRRLATGARP